MLKLIKAWLAVPRMLQVLCFYQYHTYQLVSEIEKADTKAYNYFRDRLMKLELERQVK